LPSGPLTHEWCSLKGTPRRGKYPARGPRVYQGTTNILDSDRHPPEDHLAPSLMPQLHDAGEQEAGGRVLGVHW